MFGTAIDLTLALAGTACAAYVVACTAVAHRFTQVQRRAPQLQHEYPELDHQRVHFPARDDAARIDAWYLPAKPRQAAVVLVHGKNACRGDELKAPTFAIAQGLLEAGISVLMIDLRGHGTSSGSRLSYGWCERHDVLGAVDYLIERGYEPGHIGVLGSSMGAAAALMAAADCEAIGAVVADSAFSDFRQMIRRQYSKMAGLPTALLPGALAIARIWLGVDLMRVRPVNRAKLLRGRPVLVIHSEGDRLVPASDATELAEACGGECWRTDSSGHLGSFRTMPLAYEQRVVSFFVRHLDIQSERDAAANWPDMHGTIRLVA